MKKNTSTYEQILPKPVSPEQASQMVLEAVSGTFTSQALHWIDNGNAGAPVRLVRCTTGVGKSYALRKTALKLSRTHPDRPVVIAAPTLALAKEQAESLRSQIARKHASSSHKPTVMIWFGRDAHNESGEKMCLKTEEVSRLTRVGLSPSRMYCDTKCPLKNTCLHQEQRKKKASILIITHAMLFQEMPHAGQNASAILIDETPENAGIIGLSKSERLSRGLPVSWLDSHNTNAPAQVKESRHALSQWLRSSPPGFLHLPKLQDPTAMVRLLARHLDCASKMPMVRKPEGKIHTLHESAYLNSEREIIPYLIGFLQGREDLIPDGSGGLVSASPYKAIGPSPVSALLRVEHEHGQNWLTITRAMLPVATRNTPTLIVSATPSLTLLKSRWPSIRMLCDVQSDFPNAKIIQHPGRDWSKTSLGLGPDKESPERCRTTLRALIGHYENRSSHLLVVAQKSITEMLDERNRSFCQPFRSSTETAHYNALAGIDRWGPGKRRNGVDCLLVIGRPMPPVDAVEDIARALFRRHPEHPLSRPTTPGLPPAWYPNGTGIIQKRDGSTTEISRVMHPDHGCEAVRASICDAEIAQAIGRARATRRNPHNTCEIHIYSNTSVPCLISDVIPWTDTPITHAHYMETAGIVFSSPKHAGQYYAQTLWSDLNIHNPESAIKQSRSALRKNAASAPYQERLTHSARKEEKDSFHPFSPCENNTPDRSSSSSVHSMNLNQKGQSDFLCGSLIENLTDKNTSPNPEISRKSTKTKPDSAPTQNALAELPGWAPPPTWKRIIYQASGRGMKPAVVWISQNFYTSGNLIAALKLATGCARIKILSKTNVDNTHTHGNAFWRMITKAAYPSLFALFSSCASPKPKIHEDAEEIEKKPDKTNKIAA